MYDFGTVIQELWARYYPFSRRRKRPRISRRVMYTKDILKGDDFEIGDYTYGRPVVVRNVDVRGNKLRIGRFCSVGGLTVELRGNHRMDHMTTYAFRAFPDDWPEAERLRSEEVDAVSRGDVVIGNDVWFGIGATVLSGVTIADGAVIGARAVVTRDVEPYAVVAGNPARVVGKRFDDDTIRRLLEIKWWDWPVEKIRRNLEVICSGDLARMLELE